MYVALRTAHIVIKPQSKLVYPPPPLNCRSFFGKVDSKSPSSQKSRPPTATDKANQNTTPKKSKDEDTPSSAGEGGEKDGLACSGPDSPVFKKKTKNRKRVIFDSDEEEEDQPIGGGPPTENGTHKARDSTENTVDNGEANDSGTGEESVADRETKTSTSKILPCSYGAMCTHNCLSLSRRRSSVLWHRPRGNSSSEQINLTAAQLSRQL